MTEHSQQPIPPSPLSSSGPFLRLGLLCAATGFAAVFATLGIAARVDQPVFFWPATGALIALILPYAPRRLERKLALYLCAAFGVLASGVMLGMPYRFAALIALFTAIDLLVTGALLVPNIRGFDDLKQRQNILRLIAATIVAPVLTGLLGAVPVSRMLRLPVPDVAFMSVMANAIGIAFLVPLVLLVRKPKGPSAPGLRNRSIRPLLFTAFFLMVALLVFWQNRGPYLFAIFPPMVLMLLETGLEGAVLAAIALGAIGWFATAHGHGPICLVRSALPLHRLHALQLFIWVSAMTALPVGAIVDERKKAERETRKAESVRRLLLNYASEVIVLSSFDGTERHVSPSIQALTGWTPYEYTSQDRLLTVHPDDRESAKTMLAEINPGTVTRFRYRLLLKDGGWKWVDATVCTYGEDGGDGIDGYVGTIRDISDLVESEENWEEQRRLFDDEQKRLAEAEEVALGQIRLRDEFLSNVSHELRSPLSSISSFASIIDDGLAGPSTPEQKEYCGIILKNVSQLQAMIEDLLTVTRTREGKLNIAVQPMSIVAAVSDIVRNLEGTGRSKKIALSWDDQTGVPQVLADPVRVNQVLTILVDNALKFTPPEGTVKVSLREVSDGFVLARITDTGCGIPKEKWAKVFDKLYQIEPDTDASANDARRKGLGLGLHIAKSLIAGQGGQIWVTSVPHVGSVFHFTLPVFHERRGAAAVDVPIALTASYS